MLLTQHPGLILGNVNNFSFDGWAAWNSVQKLDNVNGTHLVLASGKLVLLKTT